LCHFVSHTAERGHDRPRLPQLQGHQFLWYAFSDSHGLTLAVVGCIHYDDDNLCNRVLVGHCFYSALGQCSFHESLNTSIVFQATGSPDNVLVLPCNGTTTVPAQLQNVAACESLQGTASQVCQVRQFLLFEVAQRMSVSFLRHLKPFNVVLYLLNETSWHLVLQYPPIVDVSSLTFNIKVFEIQNHPSRPLASFRTMLGGTLVYINSTHIVFALSAGSVSRLKSHVSESLVLHPINRFVSVAQGRKLPALFDFVPDNNDVYPIEVLLSGSLDIWMILVSLTY
jgi:hypothetical protein